jgi:hypothetical protein
MSKGFSFSEKLQRVWQTAPSTPNIAAAQNHANNIETTPNTYKPVNSANLLCQPTNLQQSEFRLSKNISESSTTVSNTHHALHHLMGSRCTQSC